MAFRSDESARNDFAAAKSYLIPRGIDANERKRSEDMLLEIVDKYGAVVDSYPSWHPLVTHHDDRHPVTLPSDRSGYEGLDHTIYFTNAFITCPYGDGQKVLDSVGKLPHTHAASIIAEPLHVQFYQPNATPILVRCEWNVHFPLNSTIPGSTAIPLMLLKELPCYEWASLAETWESMRYYFLGSPHGSRSSHFVDQKTALSMKKIWNLVINTGMYGPIKDG